MKKKRILFFSISFILFLTSIGLLIKYPVVIINHNGRVLYENILNRELTVILRYIHSVEKTPIVEVYSIKSDGIYLEKFLWQSFGAGLPLEPISDNALITEIQGFYCMSNIHKKLGSNLIAWYIPENECKVQINDKSIIDINDEGLLEIRLVYTSLVEFLLKQFFR